MMLLVAAIVLDPLVVWLGCRALVGGAWLPGQTDASATDH